MKIEKIIFFLGRLYNDLIADYEATKVELEKIRKGIKEYKAAKELSAKEEANYIVAQNLEAGCSEYLQRIKNARDSIELLIKPGSSIPAYVRDLLEQYYIECKKAVYNYKEVDTNNVVSVQLSQLEGRLREAGYAIFGGPKTLQKIEEEKNQRKLKNAEKKLKKAQEAQRRLKGSAAAEEINYDSVQEKVIASDVQAVDAKEDPADPAAAENHADETNCADPTAQTGDTPADAKEDPADPAAAENHADETNCADPTAQTGDTPADSEEEPEEDTIQLVIRLIVIG